MRKLVTSLLAACVALFGLSLFGLSLVPTPARAAVISIGSLPGGDGGNPLVLPGATFTTLGGGFNMIGSFGLCPAPTDDNGTAVCTNDLQVDFDTASSDVTFVFCCNNNKTIGADIGDVQIFSGLALLGTADIVVVDDIGGFDLVDLSAFSAVTRLVISTTDFGGLLFDQFTFTADEQAIPEPATGAIMLGGIGLVAMLLRRRFRRS